MTQMVGERNLSRAQSEFCNEYMKARGNATRAYMVAYKTDNDQSARRAASRLMRNPRIKAIVDSLVEEAGLNDTYVDTELMEIIKQNEDKRLKLSGIREYNKLRRRGVHDKHAAAREEKERERQEEENRNKLQKKINDMTEEEIKEDIHKMLRGSW